MEDGQFIEYLLDKRVMRKTNNKEILQNVYASKYKKWIVKYLEKNQIDNVPILLACNTLYKLPDTFKIRKNSFFIGDFALFDYLYDWNYVLSSETYHEFVPNLCLKQCIESYYINGEMDIAYWMCLHFEGLEEYKTGEYYNKEIMTYFVDRTDIQEKFTMIHEAGHYLFRFIDREDEIKEIKEIYEAFSKINETNQFIKNNYDAEKDLYEECYCDSKAAVYVVQNRDEDAVAKADYYKLLFDTLFYVYILEYINALCVKNDAGRVHYFDYQLWKLSYRIGNVYSALYAELLNQGNEQEIEILKTAYAEFMDTFPEIVKEIREIVFNIKDFLQENRIGIKEIASVNDESKINFIKEYLALL